MVRPERVVRPRAGLHFLLFLVAWFAAATAPGLITSQQLEIALAMLFDTGLRLGVSPLGVDMRPVPDVAQIPSFCLLLSDPLETANLADDPGPESLVRIAQEAETIPGGQRRPLVSRVQLRVTLPLHDNSKQDGTPR